MAKKHKTKGKPRHRRAPRIATRRFEGGAYDRLTASWSGTHGNINNEIYQALERMRQRSRDLYQNNEYARHFFRMLVTNVVGPKGVQFQSQARRNNGTLDVLDNERIEAQMSRWSRRGQCDVTRRLSRPMMERLFIDGLARDGEVLCRKVRGYANEQAYALEFMDPELLDIHHNESEGINGNRIVMGVEIDTYWAPVAYHILSRHRDPFAQKQGTAERIRVPADQIIHAFIPMQPRQVRGVPWIHSGMRALRDLGGYREAAIIASRLGAAKNPVLQTIDGTVPGGDGEDTLGRTTLDISEPGKPWVLPEGYAINGWDPDYPHEQFGEFNKAMLRGLAGSLGVAYFTLNNDLESVNLSSARIGQQNERDTYKATQNFMLESFHADWFPEWLEMQLPDMGMPFSRFDKFNSPSWRPRTWPSPDPLKDAQANSLNLGLNLTSPQRVIQAAGEDPDEVLAEIAQWNARLEELGISASHVSQVVIANDSETEDNEQETENVVRLRHSR